MACASQPRREGKGKGKRKEDGPCRSGSGGEK